MGKRLEACEKMTILEGLYLFLIFPGFLFSVIIGLIAGWIDRKVTARLQWRVGPPWYQNFVDIAKLFYKETLIPEGCLKTFFFGMPVLAVVCASLLSAIVLTSNFAGSNGFIGDFIVVLYLAMIPSLALMFGGAASGNPLASLGASREMKLILSYELPFILISIVPILKSGYSTKIEDIIGAQAQYGMFFASPSGVLAFLVGILVIQAKLGMVPFDAAEAETEIVSGPYIEYSGKALALWKLSKAVLTVGLPMLLVTLFLGGFGGNFKDFCFGILKYVLVLVLFILIKNTNPRVRIDHALRFFWGPVTLMALVSVGLALCGR